MTSRPVYDDVLGNKMVTSGSENGRYFETNGVNPKNLYNFENISSRRIQRYQTLEIRRSGNSDDVILGFQLGFRDIFVWKISFSRPSINVI